MNVFCTICQNKFCIPDDAFNDRLKCPKCKSPYLIPEYTKPQVADELTPDEKLAKQLAEFEDPDNLPYMRKARQIAEDNIGIFVKIFVLVFAVILILLVLFLAIAKMGFISTDSFLIKNSTVVLIVTIPTFVVFIAIFLSISSYFNKR